MNATEPVCILIVDDDLLDRTAVRRALKASGVQADVTDAENGSAALAALREKPFDCIFLDYRLPGTNGLEVLRMLRAEGVKTPVIVMTGQGDEQLAVEIMKSGATDYLAKGRISPEILASCIRGALRVHQAETQAAKAEAQRQQAEAARRQSEQLLAITLKSIGDAVIATDATGNVTFMNVVAEGLTGWTAEAAIGQPFQRILPLLEPGTFTPYVSPPMQVLRSGMLIELGPNVLAEARNGHRFPIVSSSAPIRNDLGETVGVVVVFRDTTEQVRTEHQLRLLAEMSKIFSSTLDYEQHLAQLAHLLVSRLADFCAIDVQQSDRSIKRMAVAATPHLRQALIPDLESYAVDPHDSYGPARVIATGQSEYYAELPREILDSLTAEQQATVLRTGLTSWISVPLRIRGNVMGAMSLGRTRANGHFTPDDVTFVEEIAQRAALAIDNAFLYREAQEAIHTRDAFLSIAAHELKTPLTSLLGYTQLLQRRAKRAINFEERDQRVLNVINDQANRLNKMIMALFDLSRLQMGQLSIEQDHVDMGKLCARIGKEIEPTLQQHTLHLDIADESLVILGDELRLEQVIQNLIHNAIKYSPNGGAIFVRVTQTEDWVRLSVQDQGLGIPTESLPHVFHRFYRASNTEAHSISGMGVGLYVAKQIIDLHGGQVEVESTEGQGSTFTIWLPRIDQPRETITS